MTFWPTTCRGSLVPLKHTCLLNPEILPEATDPDFEFEYIDIGNVTLEGGISDRESMNFANAPSRARKPVQLHDVIVSTVRTYLKAVASIGPDARSWVVSTGFAVLRARPTTDPRYLYRVVQSNPFVEAVVASSAGVSYPAINPSTLGSITIPLPDLNTQKAIAAFLDRETARIDRLIVKKDGLLQLLMEKRRVLLKQAVTGGGKEGLPLQQDTPSQWLGRVPAHWCVGKLARFVEITTGYAFKSETFTSEGVPIVRMNNITNKSLI